MTLASVWDIGAWVTLIITLQTAAILIIRELKSTKKETVQATTTASNDASAAAQTTKAVADDVTQVKQAIGEANGVTLIDALKSLRDIGVDIHAVAEEIKQATLDVKGAVDESRESNHRLANKFTIMMADLSTIIASLDEVKKRLPPATPTKKSATSTSRKRAAAPRPARPRKSQK